jgi:rhodanese-related sulfurtransferase
MEETLMAKPNLLTIKAAKTAAAALLCAHAFVASAADANHTPAKLDGGVTVSAEQAKKLVDTGTAIIDARVANEYAAEHIKGAINVPYKEKSTKAVDFDASQDSFDIAKLPSDKSKPLIFYCNAGECWKGYKAAVVAVRTGYKQVHWLRGGIPEWKEKKLPVE